MITANMTTSSRDINCTDLLHRELAELRVNYLLDFLLDLSNNGQF